MFYEDEPLYSPDAAHVAEHMRLSPGGLYDLKRVASVIDCTKADVLDLIKSGDLKVANHPSGVIKIFGFEIMNYLLGSTPLAKTSTPARFTAETMLKIREVTRITTISRSTIDRLEVAGKFPRRVNLTAGRVAWRHSEVSIWMAQRK